MSKELIVQEPKEAVSTTILEIIARAAADPRCEVAKMKELFDMQCQIQDRESQVEFNAALARLMPRLPRIEKDGTIPDKNGRTRSRFATYALIDSVTRPLLAEEGFSISFRSEDPAPGQLRVIGRLSHRMGHSIESSVTVPIAAPPGASGTQAVGSSVSYAKRYVVTNLLNIITVGEDTDGIPTAKIDEGQVMTLETLLKDHQRNRDRFLRWARVERIEDILADDYAKCVQAIQDAGRQK